MKRILFGMGMFFLIGILRFNIPLTKNSVVGVYENTNYGHEPCCVETPHKPDILILKSEGTFTSDFYGTGTYNVNYGLLTTEIDWTYKYEMGKAGYSTYFSNKIYENPKIILNYDLNHYYKKVD